MGYKFYSLPEYLGEVRAIIEENYRTGGESWEGMRFDARRAFDAGDSPARTAKSIAYEYRLRRKQRFWYGEGPKIESGYAYVNRVGSRREWDTRVVDARLNDRARFLGFRRIDGNTMAVWRVGQKLVAQTAVGPRHPSHFQNRDRARGRR